MLTDAHWTRLEPLIEVCRPKGKTPPQDLRRTLSAIVWRHQNGAKWRAIPAELGPWSRAAQTFIRWAHLGVWERLLLLAQERGVQLGMTFLDGTSIRAHQKAAGAARKGALKLNGTPVKRWGACPGCRSGWWRTGVSAVTPSASTSGSAAHVRLFRPKTTRRQSPARTGFITIATKSSGSGQGSRTGARSRPAMRKPPPASWVSSVSPPHSTGSSHNRP